MDAEVFHSLKNLTQGVAPLTELFRTDPSRSQWLTIDACGIHADFSRQRINKTLYEALLHSAEVVDVRASLRKMMAGDVLNVTEDRRVGHMALRAPATSSSLAQQASGQLERAKALADGVRSGAVCGVTGKQFATVINIGIGGSDLGPAMVTRALRRVANGPVVKFVSNIDAADLDEALHGAHPETTLFVVSSKTFTTLETMHNAERARRWVQASVPDWAHHFIAATSHAEVALNWGIQKDRCLEFFDWVGGRFSLSSVIGFPVICVIGGDQFSEFLGGMAEMDHHAVTTSTEHNLPLMHALMWWMNSALHSFPTVAVIPYSHDLSRLPAYLQQLVMESNGKSVGVDGRSVLGGTSPVVWGEAGTNGQHAFFQMLHQGTQVVPVEFVTTAASLGTDDAAHDLLFANVIAQSEALAAGRTHSEPHKSFEGNRPSSVIALDELSPRRLGSLIAMYEHSVAIQGWLMGINSFDQWGVELGKILAVNAATAIASGASRDEQTMTHPLLNWYVSIQKKMSRNQ
ncbi:MAG: glucose-6-phosphate isomerase [Ilumatobacteraceae bacterium]|nr:glucose-6-phosphate isomerase [Ilumatobacteraceae bacterium]